MDKAPKPSQRASLGLVAHCFNYTLSPFHLLWSTISTIYPVKNTVFENYKKKVSFNSASEASYVYNLRGQICQKRYNSANFENLKPVVKQCYQLGQI